MRVGLLIARKDLRERLRDKSAFLWGIAAPLLLAAIFSFVFNPLGDQDFDAEYVLVDQDGGAIADAFTEMLEAMEDEGIVTLRDVGSVAEAEEQVEAGSDPFSDSDAERADAAFVLPEGLSEDVLAGEGGEMTVIGARGSEFGAQIAYSVASGFGAEIGAVGVAVETAIQSGLPAVTPHPHGSGPVDLGALPPDALSAQVGQLAGRAAETENPVSLEDISASTKQLDSTTYMTVAMSVFFVFFTVMFGVTGLLEERRYGTMSRLLAAPIRTSSIILGKAITSFALGVVSMAVMWVSTTLLLGAEWGNPLGVAVLIVAVVFSAMGILAVVASVAKTPEQASNAQAMIGIVLGFLGGTFFPISQIGGVLAKVSLISPHAWFIRGMSDLAGGQVADVLPSAYALLAFGLVTGAAAWVFLKRAVER